MPVIQKSVLICLLAWSWVFAQGNVFELKELGKEQITYGGFVLKNKKAVHIKAIGAGGDKWIKRFKNYHEDKHNLFAYAWILNSETREMVWRMTIDNTKKVGWSDFEREFDGEVELEAGEYEVYFATIEPMFLDFEGGFITFEKLMQRLFSEGNDWEDYSQRWTIQISGVDETMNDREVRKLHEKFRESCLFRFDNVGDDADLSGGFSLSAPLNVNIYAVGEGFQGKMFDYGWIVNAKTRRTVWTMEENKSEYGGGAYKNRVVNQDLKLDEGDYLVYFKSDDSHSDEEWNANPPYDPLSWGICIRAKDKKSPPNVVKKYTEDKLKTLISITKVGDFAYKDEGLELPKSCAVRIYALGEGRDGEMYDYGWISSATTGKTVWKMTFDETRHAGGASKNRLYEDVITLDAGRYIVHYQSDDSHSYEGWNMREPQDPDMWGITIYQVDADCEAKTFSRAELELKNILAQLIRIGDDEHVRKQFRLQDDTLIRIYALGEGDEDEMYDYGWIRNEDTKETVWKMRYDDTEEAGGSKKNRVIDTQITLPEGNYTVHYRSDDSHSYPNWNSASPRDGKNWGITIYRID